MRIVHESFDHENFMEICISPREFDLLKDYMIITQKCYIQGEIISVGIKRGLEMKNEEIYEEFEEKF